ncbi:hypothetical protein Pcinc_013131 [Petrolisthes cinctipes]|uniref:Transposase n=1 Tax=Petrolisthes cinctipes TaxID=88211 RepID=A0AAE1KSK4_PETCI|nr:hypothetical protein Pcinc_013131 [Petrolisthes cinctipes]
MMTWKNKFNLNLTHLVRWSVQRLRMTLVEGLLCEVASLYTQYTHHTTTTSPGSLYTQYTPHHYNNTCTKTTTRKENRGGTIQDGTVSPGIDRTLLTLTSCHNNTREATIYLSVERRLREYGSLNARAVDRGRPHGEQVLDAEEDILDAIAGDPSTSTRRLGARFGVSHASVWRIVNRNGLHPYHYQIIHALNERDYQQRVDFCRWLLTQERENNGFVAEVLFSDEANFTRNGMVNQHNTHTWAAENPHATTTRGHQERFSINVWAGILGDHLIGPFMLPQRLTANVYTRFLQDDLPILLEDVPFRTRRQMWFMQDGAPAHFARDTRDFINVMYPDKWIGRVGPIAWPPKSPDLTPLDFYLWGHLKSRVYATQINTRQELW